jgi:hypothetical protein
LRSSTQQLQQFTMAAATFSGAKNGIGHTGLAWKSNEVETPGCVCV